MIKTATYETALTNFKMTSEDDILIALTMTKEKPTKEDTHTPFFDNVINQINEYLNKERKTFTIPYKLTGTNFQIKVYEALAKIPYGETRSYKDIAKAIGNEKACRAVGGANNKNPILLIIPCHRVIGSKGELVGFGQGIEIKQILLNLEK